MVAGFRARAHKQEGIKEGGTCEGHQAKTSRSGGLM
jgi:hypothetical protein